MCKEICFVALIVTAGLVAGVAEGAPADVKADSSLVGWWTFDEGSGEKAADHSGNGRDGKVFGETSWIPGVAGAGALNLVDGGVLITDDAALRPSVYTLCVWLRIAGAEVKAPILEKGTGKNRCYTLLVANRKVAFQIRGSDKKTHKAGIRKGGGTLAVHKWSHVAAVYDGDQMLIYINGKMVGKRKVGKVGAISTIDKPLIFGNRWPKMGRPLNAAIDDVRIYNRPLSADEIMVLYAWKGGSQNLAAIPEPADRGEDINPNTQLKWLAGKKAVSHNVFFGTDYEVVGGVIRSSNAFKGNQKSNSFAPGGMKYGTTYYWRIDEVSEKGAGGVTIGNVWSFTTLDGKAQKPNPPLNIKTVATTAKLSWVAGELAKSHDVYFGTDAEQVKNATASSKLYKKNLAAGNESFDPGKLEDGVYYYWRIDEKGKAGVAKGDVWNFQTQGGNLIFQVDLALPTCDRKDVWEGTGKPGWTIWASNRWPDMYMHDGVWFPTLDGGKKVDPAGLNGSGVHFYLTTGSEGQLGIGAKGICRANLGGGGCPKGKAKGGPIANTWAYAVDWAGPYAGDIILLIRGLPAGVYELHSYHNHWEPCKQSTRNCLDCDCGMPPMPSITANPLPTKLESDQDKSENILSQHRLNLPKGTGKGVTAIKNAYNVAPQHVLSDDKLVPSVIKFMTDGSEVLVIYEADKTRPLYPDCARKGREGARGILNAFELVGVDQGK